MTSIEGKSKSGVCSTDDGMDSILVEGITELILYLPCLMFEQCSSSAICATYLVDLISVGRSGLLAYTEVSRVLESNGTGLRHQD